MNEHYFSQNPEVEHDFHEIVVELRGRKYIFLTDAGVFSRKRIDRGTELLIKAMQIKLSDKVLDMGCGYGPIGIVAADLALEGQVVMVDINQRAVELAKENLERNCITNARVILSDGFSNVEDKDFDVILMNPPFRAGKKVVYPLIEKSREHLKPGGLLYTVCRTRQGAKSLAKKIEKVFGEVDEVDKGSGYRVYCGIKR
ncbi:16S rRNA methyltransferase [Anoxybacter fermentans]|uniref:16S rRNA methyltransferase n=1 Tax=Anoxybacter fermentans TaxID=1323375 RepID=A0A3Q9HSZ1_9FIRM|nr:class I SAM-dependent methyltransferase [Anoxybacter fermentans]AZR74703.1 16S rRNA methyltransferase [Anoxybacter fermentans]